MPSVREIAERAGVSITTVSRALNSRPDVSPKTRDLVMKAANRVGYANKSTRKTGAAIGLVQTGADSFFFSDYDSQLLHGIQTALRGSKCSLMFVDLQREKSEDESYSQFFHRLGLRGVILRTNTRYRQVCQAVFDEGFPAIVIAERFESENISYIYCDSEAESTRAVEHLIGLGHERIALAIHGRADGDHLARQHGYEAALAAHGLELDPSLIVKISPNFDGGGNALNQLLSMQKPPTAVYFTDPGSSVGAICRALEIGLRVPDDFSIVGFDDGESRSRVYPRLTAVCQNTHELGFEAALWITRRLAGEVEEPYQKTVSAFLEINQSTGAPSQTPPRFLPSGQRIV